jgi:SAM-dependent methyltransferase
MRVLDVGSGAGDVALLAADLVGTSGEVVGTDRSAGALARARERANSRSVRNVTFREGDPAEMKFDKPFDAVIGRYVLMFQRDPATMLRGVAKHARRGGIVFFHEIDWDGVRSSPPAPIYERCARWTGEALRRSGADIRMGTRLFSTFIAAGLAAPSTQLEALIAGVANNAGPLHVIADLTVSMADAIQSSGVATAPEIGVETLTDRMVGEAAANGSVVQGRFEIAAWSRA